MKLYHKNSTFKGLKWCCSRSGERVAKDSLSGAKEDNIHWTRSPVTRGTVVRFDGEQAYKHSRDKKREKRLTTKGMAAE